MKDIKDLNKVSTEQVDVYEHKDTLVFVTVLNGKEYIYSCIK